MTINDFRRHPVSANDAGWLERRAPGPVQPDPGHADGGAEGIVPGTLETGQNYYFTAQTVAQIVNPVLGPITVPFRPALRVLEHLALPVRRVLPGQPRDRGGRQHGHQRARLDERERLHGLAAGLPAHHRGHGLLLPGLQRRVGPALRRDRPPRGRRRAERPGLQSQPAGRAPVRTRPPSARLQVVKLASQTSFIGGVDVANDIATYPLAYTDPQGMVDPNEVYRAVVAPPPLGLASGDLIPEDPVVAASQDVQPRGSPDHDQPADVRPRRRWTSATRATRRRTTQSSSAAISGGIDPEPVRRPPRAAGRRQARAGQRHAEHRSVDPRRRQPEHGPEHPASPANPTTLGAATGYNGLVYIYDDSNNALLGVPNNLNAILLANATTTPNFQRPKRQPAWVLGGLEQRHLRPGRLQHHADHRLRAP